MSSEVVARADGFKCSHCHYEDVRGFFGPTNYNPRGFQDAAIRLRPDTTVEWGRTRIPGRWRPTPNVIDWSSGFLRAMPGDWPKPEYLRHLVAKWLADGAR